MRYLQVALVGLFALAGLQAATVYGDSASFLAGVGATKVDGYEVADGYPAGSLNFLTNAQMNAVFGETRYQSTGFTDWNMVGTGLLNGVDGGKYCAGCNGSFLLDFTATSLGTAQGVFGVGVGILVNSPSQPFHAFVTFGDNTTSDYLLPSIAPYAPAGYFGITDPRLIQSIHFGLSGGGSTQGGAFTVEDLTIAGAQVPEPASVVLLGSALAAFALLRRRH